MRHIGCITDDEINRLIDKALTKRLEQFCQAEKKEPHPDSIKLDQIQKWLQADDLPTAWVAIVHEVMINCKLIRQVMDEVAKRETL